MNLQELCRHYLSRLRYTASRYGLGQWVDDLIESNLNETCSATEEEVEMLSRICDDERVNRHDIPHMLGMSYRKCFETDIFDHLKKLKHLGTYSKVNVLLFKDKKEDEKQ